MTKLYEKDILFLLDKTKLPLKKLLYLIEDDRDFDLVIDSIASNLTEDEISKICDLSPRLKVKLAVYHTTKNKNYDISEKSFVCDILTNNYNYVFKNGYVMNPSSNEQINSFLNIIKNNDVDIESNVDCFNGIGKNDVGTHIGEWIIFINQSKQILCN